MPFPFSFEGRIQRLPYAAWSLGLFFSQHLIVILTFNAHGGSPPTDVLFVLAPLRSLTLLHGASDLTRLSAFAYLMIAAWALAALACRRAADAELNDWTAALAVAPIVQIPAITLLSFVPSRAAERISAPADRVDTRDWSAVAQGVVAGMGVILLAVSIGALVFGTYGFGMFVLSPFVIGAITAYFANRKADLGASRTAALVAAAGALGGIALIVAALEGLVCIILASPLGLGVALVGGMLGRAVALRATSSPGQTVSGIALLPLVFALETALPAGMAFDTYQVITVHAAPERVWQAIVHTGPIDEPPALPFRLGMAYPLRGDIIGEGVGAERRGEFSTGTAIERITEWAPNQKLAFVVERDVPAMHEMSPYAHVHAPHVSGYFRTTRTSFELIARPGGHTDIVERTSHELRLEPVPYWLPMARWIVAANNARVLEHIRRAAERSARDGG